MRRPGELEVLWLKILAVLEEASWTIVRTALSPSVRDAFDFGCLLYDVSGKLVAQNTTVAAKIGVYHTVLDKIVEYYPIPSMREGDVFITNDPWLTEGHLDDISIIMPIFRKGRVIAFVECIAHVADIGASLSNTVTDLYGEGLQIPICHFARNGEENVEVIRFIDENVRVPEVLADLRALAVCCVVISEKCAKVMDEHDLDNLDDVFDEILNRTERAIRASIRSKLKPGVYVAEVQADGRDEAGLRVRVTATVSEDAILLDFAGTSEQSRIGINSCFNVSYAWAMYAVRTLTDIAVPNNAGCFAAVRMIAPEGCVVNPRRPAPVRNRAATAHFVPQAVFAALSEATTERAIAQSGSPIWAHRVVGHTPAGRTVAGLMLYNGGMGARTGRDGPGATSFPSNAGNPSVEALENWFPIRFERKELIPDSGGIGEQRGGPGQRIAYRALPGASLSILFMHERIRHRPQGALGGGPGRSGAARLNGEALPTHGGLILNGGDLLELETPGGGGLGLPANRRPAAIDDDLRSGLTTKGAV